MNAEIITVGTELLLGEIVNTNAKFLAEELAACGISTFYQSTVGDNAVRMKKALQLAGSRSDIIIITGGLGPTDDDITKQTIAEALGISLVEDKRTLQRIEEYFKKTGRTMSENNRRQALIPEGAEIFDNDYGTAPGCALTTEGQCIIMLPGPPRELYPMFKEKVVPFLSKYSDMSIVSHVIRIFGRGEAQIAEMLDGMFDGKNPTVGIYAGDGEVRLRVTASGKNEKEAESICRPMVDALVDKLGNLVYGVDCNSIEEVVVNKLREKGLVMATAESCTAGLLSKRITDISGSSDVFHMGVAAYANQIKTKVLGVPAELIEEKGAVSAEVACEMAKGILSVSGSDIGIGITGVAGESVENKPSGLVYIAMADKDHVWVRELNLGHNDNEREYIKYISASNALDMIRQYVDALPGVLEGELLKEKESVFAKFNPENVEMEQSDVVYSVQEEPGDVSHEVKKKREKNISKRIARFFIPYKGDSATEILRKVVLLVAVVAMVASGIYIGDYFGEKVQFEGSIEELRDVYNPDDDTVNEDGIFNRFSILYKKNSDIVGWISINGTQIDNPVYQTTDNSYYLNHDANKESSIYGTLFADTRAEISENYNSQNITIYGHNMKDGNMLHGIKSYKSVDYYKEHPTITFDSIYANGTYKIFAAFITNSDKKDDNGYYFDYTVPEFYSQSDFLAWVEQVNRRSYIKTGVDVKNGDRILTLSTCTYDAGNDIKLRFVVMARKVREGESESVNTKVAKQNSSPLYPQCWYDRYGGSKPTYDDGLKQWFTESTNQVVTIVSDSSESKKINTSSKKATSSSSSSKKSSSSSTTSSKKASSTTSSKASSVASSSKPSSASSKAPSASSASSGSASTTSSKESASSASTSVVASSNKSSDD